MKFFGFNITRNSPPAPLVRSSPSVAAWLRGDDVPDCNHHSLLNSFEQVTWVHRAATVLAEQIANIPFRFSRGQRGGELSITSGPLIDFYDQPHPYIDRF